MKLKIGILGAESTGKSVLSLQLAQHFSGVCVPEYAREYVEKAGGRYTYSDVEAIAEKQIEQLQTDYETDYVFFDTELIITKVWFSVKYAEVPDWFEKVCGVLKPDFSLLCMPDLPFVADPVRENPHLRKELTDRYIYELQTYNIPFALISGSGSVRLQNAINAINSYSEKIKTA